MILCCLLVVYFGATQFISFVVNRTGMKRMPVLLLTIRTIMHRRTNELTCITRRKEVIAGILGEVLFVKEANQISLFVAGWG
jgi:hypothetical protein